MAGWKALPWSPNLMTTSPWGVKKLNGFAQGEGDITGTRRRSANFTDYSLIDTLVSVGAYDVPRKPTNVFDGVFLVPAGAGVTSAGLFTHEGKCLTYLFHDLPLPAGSYHFWLPPGVPAGDYELRTAHSNLGLRYIGLVGATGGNNDLDAPSIDPDFVIYDQDDHPILFQGGAEDHTFARSFDAGLQHGRWRLGGDGGAVAAALGDDGNIYALQADGSLLKLSAATGVGVPIENGNFRKSLPGVFSDKVAGMACLGKDLFVADTGKNKLLIADTAALEFNRSFGVESPRWPVADPAHGLLWVISGDKLVALDATSGARKYQVSPVGQPEGLALRGDRLAVMSGQTHRIHIFDCSDPAALKPLNQIGREWKRGDSGYGPLEADRIYSPGPIALDGKGGVAAIDGNRVRLFTATGAAVHTPLPFWGQQVPYGTLLSPEGVPTMHVSGLNSNLTIAIDPKTGTWSPGYRFFYPKNVPGGVITFFHEGGRNFAVFADSNIDTGNSAIVRLDNGIGRPVLAFGLDKTKNAMAVQTDSNGDGEIDATDVSTPLQTPQGVPVAGLRFLQDGRLIAGGTVIPRHVSADGTLSYDWSKYIPAKKVGALEYGGQGSFNGLYLPDGSWVTAAGPGRGFGGGYTVMKAADATGAPRWSHPLDYHYTTGGFRSLRAIPGVLLSTTTEELDTAFVDYDGLGLGVTGPIPDLEWRGYWHDQDWSLAAFPGDDGKQYLLLGDYTRHAYHWMEVTGLQSITHSRVAVRVDSAKARVLASAPELLPVNMPKPPTPEVLVAKLAAPLNVDGDLKKWRDLGIEPQIVVMPPGIEPSDCSALVRVAWEGDNLYFQVIKFDDVVTMFQPLAKHYKQDSTELALVGGFMGGYKFSITRTTDSGDILYREQFLMHKELNLDPLKAPRVIRVLESASDVEERKLIEKTTGVDLSKSKVIITEFKIPMSYAWDGKAPIAMQSGTKFWMGLFIDDNDTPGLDAQKAYSWPVTFQAFGNPDQGAQATLQ